MKPSLNFIKQLFAKCQEDELTIISGHLTYVTLLSFIPFVTVILGIFGSFDFFDSAQKTMEGFLFDHFVPNAGQEITQHLNRFIDNVSEMKGLSLAALLFVAMMLLKNVDKELNKIFKGKKLKPFWQDLLTYLLVIIVGPLLIGISLAATSAFLALEWINQAASWLPTEYFTVTLPLLFSFLYFLLLYRIVPTAPPSNTAAILGALMTSIFFELIKYLFGWYINAFPTYQVIYGSLAAIPIFFLWVYVSWLVVLFGAELTCIMDLYQKKNDINTSIIELDDKKE
ncbi:hypothetical protein XM47_10990 [Catenovulum maritimum]|uniref:Uncharacterized protein n=1 Tax=Catenovulum maritimum TaxID=1513271 RepID=A0A0J8GQM7_9ALTE|nr:hypothetical protein XM47_10990 [Catenovulum maritimum]